MPHNQQIKRTENSCVLTEKQNKIAVVGRKFSPPPLIANRCAAKMNKGINKLKWSPKQNALAEFELQN